MTRTRRIFIRLSLALAVLGTAVFAVRSAPLAAQAQATLTIGVIGEPTSPTFRGVALAVAEAGQPIALPDGTTAIVEVVALSANRPEDIAAALASLQGRPLLAVFGPDNDAFAAAALPALSAIGVPVFTASSSTDVKVGGLAFRTQANDIVKMSAAVDELLIKRAFTRVAVYQGGATAAAQTAAFVVAMAQRGVQPATTVLQLEGSAVQDSVTVALQSQPQAIAAFGTADQAQQFIAGAVTAGFTGTIFTQYADDPAFVAALPVAARSGLLAALGWSARNKESWVFSASYVATFNAAPTALSAAAYDGANMLLRAMKQVGAQPAALTAIMPQVLPFAGAQGAINPGLGNGEISRNVALIETRGEVGYAPNLVARFEGTTRLPDVSTTNELPTAVAAQPTVVPTDAGPVVTATPNVIFVTATPLPATATPEGIALTVINDFVNVRSGPGQVYLILGKLTKDMQVKLFGRNETSTWFVINFSGQQAWVTGDKELVAIFGDISQLPVVQAPPTPTPTPGGAAPVVGATAVPGVVQGPPDVVLTGAQLNPATLNAGQAFQLIIKLKNQGGTAAGPFAVAAAFKPGEIFGATFVTGLAPGQEITATINYAGVQAGPGSYTIAIVLDLNNEVQEGDAGEANNKPVFSYTVN